MKLWLLAAAFACLALSQDTPAVEVKITPLGIPCEPGQPLPLGSGFPIPCPPVEEQGIMLFLKTSEPSTAAYKAKVRYTTADGEQKESEQVVPRSQDGEWTAGIYKIGRIRTDTLSGNTIDGVDVEQLSTLDSASGSSKKKSDK
ncbi:MAG: hypothetical protein IT167_22230 [Bryobacterales bacterium]|nr:hypothetical protein [Bryobacterales bacterium]